MFFDPDERTPQQVEAGSCGRHNRVHRHTEKRAEFRGIDLNAAFLGGVSHRQGDDGRQLEFDELLDEKQALVEVCSVKHREYTVRRPGAFHAAEDHIDRNVLFQRMGAKGMRTGQVDEFDSFVFRLEQTDVALDGNARVVANVLLEPGQAIEQRAFA